MNQEHRQEELIKELDALIPKNNAKLLLCQYGGGPDESKMIGTIHGYRRLGIELLKAPVETTKKGVDTLKVDIPYLIADKSDIHFDWFEITDDIESLSEKTTLAQKVGLLLVILFFMGVCICTVIGFGTLISWLL